MQGSFSSPWEGDWGGPVCGPRLLRGVLRFLARNKKLVLAAVIVAGAVKVAKIFKRQKLRVKWNSVGRNVVVLHTIPPGNVCPSITPFAVKLETFFRMMDIKYVFDYEEPMGPKSKVPWITLNGEDLTDSELIVQKLQITFNKFPDADVPKEQRAVGLAMQIMMEEHLYWGLVSWRYLEDKMQGLKQVYDMPPFMLFLFSLMTKKLKKVLYMQGLGRHSIEDLHSLMKRDLEALSSYLGEKPFLYGADPQVVDCAIFGSLTQIIYNAPGSPYLRWVDDDFPNLRAYTDRMKQRFWPDWNQCIKKPSLTL